MRTSDFKLKFYDIERRKFIAECKVKSIFNYTVVGDELIVSSGWNYKRISLPFLQKARQGDFLFYDAIDSVLPNPFTSVYDLLPKNRAEVLKEFAVYPSHYSSSHHATF